LVGASPTVCGLCGARSYTLVNWLFRSRKRIWTSNWLSSSNLA